MLHLRFSLVQARQGMNQHSNMYSGQVQQHGQSSYYSNTQSPSSAMQQVTNTDLMFRTFLKSSSCLWRGEGGVAQCLLLFVPEMYLSVLFIIFSLNLSPGHSPSAQFPAVPAKLWLRWRPASSGTATHASPSPAPHQSTAPSLPTIQRHHGPQPQHDAASNQQGTAVCMRGSLTHVSRGRSRFLTLTHYVDTADGHGSETVWQWNGCEAWNTTCQCQEHYTHLQPLQVPPHPRIYRLRDTHIPKNHNKHNMYIKCM